MKRNKSSTKFESLFQHDSPRIYAYIRTLVPNREDAHDVYQNTCTALWKKFSEFHTNTNFLAWSRQVARYEILAYYRSSNRQLVYAEDVMDLLSVDIEKRSDEFSLRSDALKRCIEELSGVDRSLIQKRYRYNYKVTDIAKQMSRSPATVYRSLGKIHSQLLHCIERTLTGRAV